MTAACHTLLVFVDGLGLAAADPLRNPVAPGVCPTLVRLIERHAVPIDAQLGVPGLPQSATGQTALLTGVNAAQAMQRHIEGFPGPGLCRIIRDHNIFSQFAAHGLTATFANGYYLANGEEAARLRLRSVTTVATLAAFGRVRDRAFIERNEAVCQDLTRRGLVDRGYTGPILTEPEAAGHLLAIARQHDFTLFEYFQTDRAGHSRDMARAKAVLASLDRFLGALVAAVADGPVRLLLTSDHGNIEDMGVATHTRNPVPFVVLGSDAARLLGSVRSLVDITPAVLALHTAGRHTDGQ